MSRKQFERFVLQKYLGGNVRKYKQTYNMVAYLVDKNHKSNHSVNKILDYFETCTTPFIHKKYGYVVKLNNDQKSFVVITIEDGEAALTGLLDEIEVIYEKLNHHSITQLNKRIQQIWLDGTVEV